jgi:hypothetical protein
MDCAAEMSLEGLECGDAITSAQYQRRIVPSLKTHYAIEHHVK